MKITVPSDLSSEYHSRVGPGDTIRLGPSPGMEVLSTPALILWMELAAKSALQPVLDPGEESVGLHVDVRHLAPSVPGASIRAIARLEGIEGRKARFQVEAFDGEKRIGEGTHVRAAVSLDKLAQQLPSQQGTLGSPPSRIVTRQEGSHLFVDLDRADKRNAVDSAMTSALEALVESLRNRTDLITVVLRGRGKVFCAGDDLRELEGLSLEQARELASRQAAVLRGIQELPQHWIALLEGPAMGAGCVLAAACDERIATHQASFGMPEATLGWAPGFGVTRLASLIGQARAGELCLGSRILTAREAHQWGLVQQLIPSGLVSREIQRRQEALTLVPPAARQETKALLNRSTLWDARILDPLDIEAYLRNLATPEARAGIRRFLERTPTGKPTSSR